MVLKRFFILFFFLLAYSGFVNGINNRAEKSGFSTLVHLVLWNTKPQLLRILKQAVLLLIVRHWTPYTGVMVLLGLFLSDCKRLIWEWHSKNIYEGNHTDSGNSPIHGYRIHFEDPNRNSDVINIPNSVEVPLLKLILLSILLGLIVHQFLLTLRSIKVAIYYL